MRSTMFKKLFFAQKRRTKYIPGHREYPELNEELSRELSLVPESDDHGLIYKPCLVTLSDGNIIDHVYIVNANSYIKVWGAWPEDAKGKTWIDIRQVIRIRESPTRLPAQFANQLYRAGESVMGGCIFTVIFFDGTQQVYCTGNAVDFIPYPDGKTPSDVYSVIPHQGRDATKMLFGSDYYWCLYGAGESNQVSWKWNA
jgi:hypothetical protein